MPCGIHGVGVVLLNKHLRLYFLLGGWGDCWIPGLERQQKTPALQLLIFKLEDCLLVWVHAGSDRFQK